MDVAAIRAVAVVGAWVLSVSSVSCAAGTRLGPGLVGSRVSLDLPGLNGGNVRLADHVGQVVLVDVWATWCTPCVASFPVYAEIYARHRASGFAVLAVSVDVEDDDVRRFIARHDVPFTVLRDPQGTLPERIGLRTMPTALVVGRDGRVAYVHEGFVPGDAAMVEREIVRLLGRPSPVGASARGEAAPPSRRGA